MQDPNQLVKHAKAPVLFRGSSWGAEHVAASERGTVDWDSSEPVDVMNGLRRDEVLSGEDPHQDQRPSPHTTIGSTCIGQIAASREIRGRRRPADGATTGLACGNPTGFQRRWNRGERSLLFDPAAKERASRRISVVLAG